MRLDLQNALREIRSPKTYLTDLSMEAFMNIVNRNYPQYHMETTLYAQRRHLYYREPVFIDDVQVLFLGRVENVGHYVCIHYVAGERILYVYDPLGSSDSADSYNTILRRRYPQLSRIVYRRPRVLQPDYISCGVFSLVYATTVILGGDPTETDLQLNSMNTRDNTMILRQHLANSIESRQLTLFPS